jgi:enoyl-[acyl-carrier protein] reductase I
VTAHFLAFDLGAESGRAMVGTLDHGVLGVRELHRFANEPVRQNGSLLWDILHLWQEMRRALEQNGRRRLESIGVDSWGVDYALIGEAGNLLENPYHYRDSRTTGVMEAVFERIAKDWGKLDFVVHSIAFSPKDALQGRVVDVSQEGFLTTMDVSCWSFIRTAHLAEPLMRKGGTLFTMTYYGSQMVVKNYNIMGVAKAALECAVRYLAAELGPKGIRVHAISPGPLATRAASGIPEFDALLDKAKAKAPARSLVSIDDVGAATAFLAHDAARLITGETLYIDGGYHIVD